MMLAPQYQRSSSISSTWELNSASFRPFWCHPRWPIRITFVFYERISIPNLVLFPNQFLSMLLKLSFPQEEQQDLQCIPMTSASYVLEHVSTHPDILIWEISNFWASSIFTWVYADIASAACPSQSGSRAITSMILAAVIWEHDLCCRHLRCWWALFSEDCKGSRVVFHNVSSKHNSSFVLLELWLQLRIL